MPTSIQLLHLKPRLPSPAYHTKSTPSPFLILPYVLLCPPFTFMFLYLLHVRYGLQYPSCCLLHILLLFVSSFPYQFPSCWLCLLCLCSKNRIQSFKIHMFTIWRRSTKPCWKTHSDTHIRYTHTHTLYTHTILKCPAMQTTALLFLSVICGRRSSEAESESNRGRLNLSHTIFTAPTASHTRREKVSNSERAK